MNHDCYGYFFERHGTRWLRCFLDSTMIAPDETPEICPSCGRRWVTSEPFKDWDPDNDYRVQLAIDLPFWKQEAELARDRFLDMLTVEADWLEVNSRLLTVADAVRRVRAIVVTEFNSHYAK